MPSWKGWWDVELFTPVSVLNMAPNGQWLYWCEVEFSLLDRSVSLRTETMEKTLPGSAEAQKSFVFLPHLFIQDLGIP